MTFVIAMLGIYYPDTIAEAVGKVLVVNPIYILSGVTSTYPVSPVIVISGTYVYGAKSKVTV